MNDTILWQQAVVLDASDNYVKNVVISKTPPDEHWVPYKCILQEGEHLLVDAPLRPGLLLVPHWTGEKWIEGGTPEKVAEWQAGRESQMQSIQPDVLERLDALEALERERLLGGTNHV